MEITLKFTLNIYDESFKISSEELQKLVEHTVLAEYSDGRYNFSTEAIEHHARDIILLAIYHMINNKNYKLYGNKMVRTSPNSRTSKAHLKTEKEFNKIKDRIYVILKRE